ncbi:MAG: CNNM domain-containing protein, partial [Flavobacteriaceae bacterium]
MDPDPLPQIITIFSASNLIMIQSLIVGVLLIGSALISGAEVAFFSLQLKSLEDIQESDTDPALERVINQLKNPKRLLATILVANNFINIAIVLVFSALGDVLFKGIENPYLILFIEIGLITSLILLFGEILPKIYANRN